LLKLVAAGITALANRPRYRLIVPRLEPRLTVRAIHPLVSGLQQMGHDPAIVVTAAGLDLKTLGDPDGRVPATMASPSSDTRATRSATESYA
jgi:hypothetical protein